MTFPVLTEEDLPRLDTTCERPDIEFKKAVDPQPSIELAKDVAALANTAGGTIIVGARTAGSVVVGYPGVARDIANRLPDAYEESASQRCRPAPKVESHLVPLHGKTDPVVVINVWPSPIAPVGVHIHEKNRGKHVADAWVFPFRVGSHTRYMQPDQFGSLENVSARRAAALLIRIPLDQWKQIKLRWIQPTGKQSYSAYTAIERSVELVEVSPDQNVVSLLVIEPPGGRTDLRLPLDWIDTVWRDEENKVWIISSSAILERQGSRFEAYRAGSST